MRRVSSLFAALMAAVPAAALAQAAGLPPLPPLSAQNPQALPKKPHPGPDRQRKPDPFRQTGLLDYMDRDVADSAVEIDTPITGYGNEALWEDLGPTRLADADRATTRGKPRSVSTSGGSNR